MKPSKKLWLDQYGGKFWASTVAELRGQIGNGKSRVSKMYNDTSNGTFHTGYVIGKHWLSGFEPMRGKP